ILIKKHNYKKHFVCVNINLIMVMSLNMSKYSIITLEEVSSTNSYAMEHIRFLDDKTVIFTMHQSDGRGRYDRKWVSDESENLYMSIVIKPENVDNYPVANLTQYLSIAVCNFLEKEFNLIPKIKWPNDILIDGYKISGILAESYIEKNKIAGIILGLGLNVNLHPETLKKIDQKAASLCVLKNKNYNVYVILEKILDYFFEHYNQFVKEGFIYIKDEYISRCNFLGKEITVKDGDIKRNYTALSINDNGLLIVKNELGNKIEIITGDILCTQI
ncbi:MAG: biotin--[acetyl-CoA-carboxylase] ligase, partial [Candidatus Gastranaerophilales bacterium]|nr:biotin--[acetyl-CoA-carboxylase] ligase [Candidatus Gastranaerophilales bacterium]